MKISRSFVLTVAIVVWAGLILPSHNLKAQQNNGDGFVRIQGRDQPTPDAAPAASPEILVDLREEMRNFVQSLSNYARQINPDFIILAMGGLDLMIKRDQIDEERVSPARSYTRSIDGVIIKGPFYSDKNFGQPPSKDYQDYLDKMAGFAKKSGLRIFSMDFGTGKNIVNGAYRKSKAKGYVSLTLDAEPLDVDNLPRYPSKPFDENPKSVVSLKDVKNYVFIGNSQGMGRVDEFALKMKDTNYDMVIVDVFHGRLPLSKRAVETLKYKKIGAKRLVLAYLDIGSAASYRYYWQPGWREGSPLWISAPYRGDPDRYHVQFWQPEWQRIISGDSQSFLYGIINQGFDGVVLDGLEAYKFYEGGGEEETQQQQ